MHGPMNIEPLLYSLYPDTLLLPTVCSNAFSAKVSVL